MKTLATTFALFVALGSAHTARAQPQAQIPIHDMLAYYDSSDHKLKGHFYVFGSVTTKPDVKLQASKSKDFAPNGSWSSEIAWDDKSFTPVGSATRVEFETTAVFDSNYKVACFWMDGTYDGISERSLTADHIVTTKDSKFAMWTAWYADWLKPVKAMATNNILPITWHRPIMIPAPLPGEHDVHAWGYWGDYKPNVYRTNGNQELGSGWNRSLEGWSHTWSSGHYSNDIRATTWLSNWVMFVAWGHSDDPTTGRRLELWSCVTRKND